MRKPRKTNGIMPKLKTVISCRNRFESNVKKHHDVAVYLSVHAISREDFSCNVRSKPGTKIPLSAIGGVSN